MDPQATWILLMNSLESGQWKSVREHAQDLIIWLDRGGFPPDTSQGKVTDRYWNRQIAFYSCKLARTIARRQLRG